MPDQSIGLAPYHIPKLPFGNYNIVANLNQKSNNDQIESTVLNEGNKQEIKFLVAGYNATIPQNEILAVYPPIEHIGNFAGTFPHIQFRRSTLPWEYEIKNGSDRLPYIFLVLLKEDELSQIKIIETDTNQLDNSTESLDEPKPLKVLNCNNSELFPKADLIKNLAHVRVQEHTEIKNLNLPKETSILVSHRMVEPNTKYRAFVCYYAKEMTDKYKMITDIVTHPNSCVILNEWSFESIGADLYQIDKDKLKNHPVYNIFSENLKDSEIDTLKEIKSYTNAILKELIEKNEEYLKDRKLRWEKWDKKNDIKGFEDQEKNEEGNNQILEYLQYNGKNLKGYLHELKLQPFKTKQYNNLPGDTIQKLLNIGKVSLEHQLKAGGKMVSWYQGPFTNNKSKFNILEKFETVPDHQDYLNLFNEDTGMYDMTYSAAWQLGRLMIMNDNKVLQELKKWKYELELYNLVLEQNKLSHLPDLSIQEPSIPDMLMNYVTELIRFRNFPLYYLLPHPELSTEESIKYFKIDNSWTIAFLFGIFSAGPRLSLVDFKKYLFENPKNLFKENLKSLMPKESDKIDDFFKEFDNPECKKKRQDIEIFSDLISQIKNELWYVFNLKKDYYGILLQSQTIKNWPHLVVELNESHNFHYVTTINNTLRLYITDKPFSSIELYLKNENAHFGKEYKSSDNKFITTYQDSVTTANNNLYKQPRVVFNIK
ncbi:hypothetical protein B4N84_07650 [Flavobacterium sp. IR1]|nr:hypothetical protein B4N84_07650 [Flavobacterium sp. IR1]